MTFVGLQLKSQPAKGRACLGRELQRWKMIFGAQALSPGLSWKSRTELLPHLIPTSVGILRENSLKMLCRGVWMQLPPPG